MGFEPTDAFTSPVFKTGAFDHSAISPCVKAHPFPDAFHILTHRWMDVNQKPRKKNEKNPKKGLHYGKRCGILIKLIWTAQQNIRVWRSLVSRLNGVQEASSSNLDTRTKEQVSMEACSFFRFQETGTRGLLHFDPRPQAAPRRAWGGLEFESRHSDHEIAYFDWKRSKYAIFLSLIFGLGGIWAELLIRTTHYLTRKNNLF